MRKKLTFITILLGITISIGATTTVVYCTPKGKCYHSTRNCKTLAKSKTIREIDIDTARAKNLKACKVCY